MKLTYSSSFSLLEAEHFQQKLDETTVLLRELQKAQKERLSAKQPPNIICLLAPTAKELELGMHTNTSTQTLYSSFAEWFLLLHL